jgi:formamidopyrimidine-DNA glycosylase
VSIEAPEAYIWATQMSRELVGKQVASFALRNCEKMQKIGCINRDASAFNQLIGKRIVSITSRGVVSLLKLEPDVNLLLAPEYGGRVLYHKQASESPINAHFTAAFTDGSSFSVSLTGLGGFQVFRDTDLSCSYVYRRDFSDVPSPLSEEEFTLQRFSNGLAARNANIKAAIVGKDALVVGLSNCSFQDILFHAKIHPKRKASSLTKVERVALFGAARFVVTERVRLGGKNQFIDFYGVKGRYIPPMGPNVKGMPCSSCGATVEVLSLGGGQVYFCPKCQT